MDATHLKLQALKARLSSLGSVAVAFSSGVDSSFLLKVAHDLLGDRAVALTARAPFFPAREQEEAKAFCRREGIRQILLDYDILSVEGVRENPRNRCYLCKRAIFTALLRWAEEQGFRCVAEGSNLDDCGDYRPGMRAVAELGIQSPLREAELTKAEIRLLSKELGLPTWDKPSFACLASRFVYGETITREKLSMVEQAEQLLLEMGFRQMRVRIHGTMARIELLPEDFPRLISPQVRETVCKGCKALGFSYVSMDLMGYRTGSMNDPIL